jgi:hypothetical protein
MGQVNMVEIKEATEKGRDGKAEAAKKKSAVSKSAQSAPSVPRGHPAVIPKKTDAPPHHSALLLQR